MQSAADDSPISEYELWQAQENEFNSLLEQMKSPFVRACFGNDLAAIRLHIFFAQSLVPCRFSRAPEPPVDCRGPALVAHGNFGREAPTGQGEC